jgi:hypothetical protein
MEEIASFQSVGLDVFGAVVFAGGFAGKIY